MVSDGIGNRLVWNLLSCLSGEEAVAYRLQAEPDWPSPATLVRRTYGGQEESSEEGSEEEAPKKAAKKAAQPAKKAAKPAKKAAKPAKGGQEGSEESGQEEGGKPAKKVAKKAAKKKAASRKKAAAPAPAPEAAPVAPEQTGSCRKCDARPVAEDYDEKETPGSCRPFLLGLLIGPRSVRALSRKGRGCFVVQLAQGVAGGPLFGFFLIASPGRLVTGRADLCGDLEALAVVGAFFVQKMVAGRGAVFPLGQLLQQRFVVAAQLAAGRQLDLGITYRQTNS